MKVITAININKKFNDNIILDNANLQVEKGEVLSILERSGECKSTFLRILASLENLDSGEIKNKLYTILIVTHDLDFAKEVSTRIVNLKDGKFI